MRRGKLHSRQEIVCDYNVLETELYAGSYSHSTKPSQELIR